ncbi:hypothetical protein SBOR_4939 [Sclerotinia borealis F-4128]|uniref:Uncharacterized protein n=1 Tax=Sclerotinia borealis (strain F-4128) TaxID=1432307 RepID=W9CFK0_SCLBF|nr:hypothetical protein SBOR_4939 [Sclerotinia borealis F-4128]
MPLPPSLSTNKPTSHPSTSTSIPPHQAPDPTKPTEPSIEHPQIPYDTISECTVVRILGVMGSYMNMPQIQIVKMGVVGSTDGERKWWDECTGLKEGILGKEWLLTQEEIERWKRRERRKEKGDKEAGDRKRDEDRKVREMDKRRKGRDGENAIANTNTIQGKRAKEQEERARTNANTTQTQRNKQEIETQLERAKRRKANPHPHPRPQPNPQAPTNDQDKDQDQGQNKNFQKLLEVATRPSYSNSNSTSKPISKPKPSHKPPIQKRIIPVNLPDLAQYDTFGL